MVPSFFFFNDTATTEIYTLSLHDALPISARGGELIERPVQTRLVVDLIGGEVRDHIFGAPTATVARHGPTPGIEAAQVPPQPLGLAVVPGERVDASFGEPPGRLALPVFPLR